MKIWPYILTAIVFFFLGVWGAASFMIKPVAQIECVPDTVFVPGKTIVVDKPKPVSSHPKKDLRQTLFVSCDTINHLPDIGSLVCDSIRTYEYSDSVVTIKDSVQGVLLRQTILYKPTVRISQIVRKDSLIYKSGIYFGGGAGLNSIRAEIEYVDKNGWSYSGGYDLINKSPVLGIRRKIW